MQYGLFLGKTCLEVGAKESIDNLCRKKLSEYRFLNYQVKPMAEVTIPTFEETMAKHEAKLAKAAGIHVPVKTIQNTLADRGTIYGAFIGNAEVSQRFKTCMHIELEKRNKLLPDLHREALDMIFHKIARIINGDANYTDSWHDIAGYATLVEEQLHKNKAPYAD